MNTKPSSFLANLPNILLALLFLLSLGWMSYGNYLVGAGPGEIAGSALLLAVPLGLFYLSIGLLLSAQRQRRAQGQIGPRLSRWLYWMPRIAGLLITLFVSLFALDVFSEPGSIWLLLGAFVIHALPAIVMAGLLALAWRWPWVGFGTFLLAALYFLRFALGNLLDGAGNFLLFSGPMVLIAALFWANARWHIRRKQAPATFP